MFPLLRHQHTVALASFGGFVGIATSFCLGGYPEMVERLAAQVEQFGVRVRRSIAEQQAVAGMGSNRLEPGDGGLKRIAEP